MRESSRQSPSPSRHASCCDSLIMTSTCMRSILWLALLAPAAVAHAQPPKPLPFSGDSLVGKDSFEAYCASCHGSDARGNGPVAESLRNLPADLTVLASRNNDSFPSERVAAVLRGTSRTVVAHGTRAMPIWGPMFRMFESDARTQVRIDNLVAYIETLQARSRETDAGRDLFRGNCAVCHGVDARGAGPMSGQLRRVPPSLTSYAVRNGGVFPSERLRTIIDGRLVGSHGTSEMPVWGDAFRRTRDGLSGEVVKARIDAIVKYLEAIQERATF
jgi:mono/diheme cytochrome c family protein